MTDADRIRAELVRLGYSQRGLARELDLDERTVRRYCSGDSPVPRVVWIALRTLKQRKGRDRKAAIGLQRYEVWARPGEWERMIRPFVDRIARTRYLYDENGNRKRSKQRKGDQVS